MALLVPVGILIAVGPLFPMPGGATAISLAGAGAGGRARERWDRGRLLAFQAAALGRLRSHAYANSPFYRRFHRGLNSAPLAELPVLTKATLMEQFDALVTDREVRLAEVEAHLNGPACASRSPGR